jgi:dephospho-CoA kinase
VLRVGLTGGIATGKSHVAHCLAQAGFHTLDLDRVAHAVVAPGAPAHAEVVRAFGAGVVAADGSIDRKALGRIVFADPLARERLNRIVHPRVRDEESRIASGLARTPDAVLVVEAALLVESGIHLRFDRLFVAHCAPEEQARRLEARDGLDVAAVRARLRAQMAPSDKRRFAHAVVDTSGSLAQTEARADELARELRALAQRGVREIALRPALSGGLLSAEVEGWSSAEQAERGLDLGGLRERLYPGLASAWYAPPAPASVAPEAIAGFSAHEALRRRGDDQDYAAAVAYSLARLTQPAAEAVALVTLVGLALHEAACGRSEAPSPVALDLCRRWTDGEAGASQLEASRVAVARLRAAG